MSDKDWIVKDETTYYRCGCIDTVHAVCGMPGQAPSFYRTERRCPKHAAEQAAVKQLQKEDEVHLETDRVREAIYDFALEWGKCK